MLRRRPMLKPQDIVAILKVHSWPSARWTYSTLAQSLGMSTSEVHAALARCEAAGLYNAENRRILKQALLEFLVHGLRYVFYTTPGPLSLIDALRVGRVREQRLAVSEFENRIVTL